MLAIVDYGAGNLRSVTRAVHQAGCEFEVTQDPGTVATATGLILPGVGAAADIMTGLAERALLDAVKSYIESGRPFLGVCMGLQVLFERSEEDDGTPCMGVYSGTVRKFRNGLHVPHMGWNQVHSSRDIAILDGVAQDTNFYFAHSFYAPADAPLVGATTEYGVEFLSVLRHENVYGTQFHPEKSGAPGLRVYANFARLCGETPRSVTP